MTGPSAAVAAVRSAVAAAVADLAAGDQVLVACSGGPDSLALAAAVGFLAPRHGLIAGAVVVDHGLQPGSDRIAGQAAATCRDLGLRGPGVIRVQVGVGGGPEAAARDARHEALTRTAAQSGARAVLYGHTLDDQAETVLLGLARGSGARSLAAMTPVRGIARRPLLEVRRETTRQACADLGLTPWTDPHNGDDRFTRVRIRRDVMPVLAAALGPGVPCALARTAASLRDDADALDEWAVDVAAQVERSGGVDAVALAGHPAAIRRRVLLASARSAGAPPGSLTATHAAAMDALVARWRGQGPVALPGGVGVVRRDGVLWFAAREGTAGGPMAAR